MHDDTEHAHREGDTVEPREEAGRDQFYLGEGDLGTGEAMAFETSRQRKAIQEWSRLAIQLLGAAESGHFDHITPFHVRRNGLALLVAYILHLVDIMHTKVPV
jgi:hypothetical protein